MLDYNLFISTKDGNAENEIKNCILCLHWEFPSWFLSGREKNTMSTESQPGLPKSNHNLSFCVFLILCDDNICEELCCHCRKPEKKQQQKVSS